MASSFSLHIRHHTFSAEQLKDFTPDPTIFSRNTIEILQFCRDWLNGQESFLLNTSGSTGKPKTISLSRTQMQASARQTIQALNLKEGSSALLCINALYIGGKMMIVRAIEGNFDLTAVEAEADPLAQFPSDTQFYFIALVPLQLEAIIRNPDSKGILQRAKAIIIGGAPVSLKLREKLYEIKAPLYSTYGMTETVSHIALQRLNGPKATPYFKAFPDIQLSQDERGCLEIKGAVTGEETVVTNDVVELLSPHSFIWTGRADNIINSGGIKIQLEKVDTVAEQCLLETGNSRNLFAWGIPDERLGQKLALFVEGDPLSREEEVQWQKLLAQGLVRYQQPKAIFYLKKFIQTPSGKIQKAATAALISKA